MSISNLSLVHRVRRRRRALVLLAGLLILLAPGSARADAVIGSGTPASCQTEQARNNFRIAVEAGGTITFNCGAAPVVIEVDTNLTSQTAVVDGGGKITLDGRDAIQHFYVTGSGNLTLNGVTLFDGGGSTGGAIFVDTQATVTFNNGYIVSSGSSATNGGSIYNRGRSS